MELIKRAFAAFFWLSLAIIIFVTIFAVAAAQEFVLFFVEPVELPRDNQGYKIVNIDNYDNLKVVKAVKPDAAVMEGEYALRSYQDYWTGCPKSLNVICDNYESYFYELRDDIVVMIRLEDDNLFSEWRMSYINSISAHNSAVIENGYDADIKYEAPNLTIEYINLQNIDSISNLGKKVEWAKQNCRNNASGCQIRPKLIYDNVGAAFLGPRIDLY